jgi:large repetitive protein
VPLTPQLTLNTATIGQQEIFGITAVDGDGDSITRNLVVNLHYTPPLDANRDVILTNVASGTPINISAEALIHNDATTGSTAAITSVQTPVNGTVTGTTNVVFTPNVVPTNGAIQIETEGLFGGALYDGTQIPTNNIRENAVDLTDRSRYGSGVVPAGTFGAGAATTGVIDTAAGAATGGRTQVFSGTIDYNTVSDIDYVKVKLFAGETIFVDVDNNTRVMNGQIEYFNAAGVLQPVVVLANLSANGDTQLAPNASFTAPIDGEYYIRLSTAAADTTDTNYNLLITINNVQGAINEFGQFDYTLTEGATTNNATADIFRVTGNTIVGGEGDEIIIGGATNDILRGNGGNDVLQGNAGTDNLSGGIGADRLEGGAGDDTLDGGTGNDIIVGGANNDLLTGGSGSDSFVWKLSDKGTVGAPAQDTITDFSTAVGVDRLDLRDLLVAEVSSGPGANLENYLHFVQVGADTVIHISNTGAYSTGFNAANDVQTITLTGYNVTSFAGDQAAIIADLITKQKLITD